MRIELIIVIAFLILESHFSEINQPFDACLLKVRQSSAYFRNDHHLAATPWSSEEKIHSFMQSTQPLYLVSRQLISSYNASKYRNESIDNLNVLSAFISVPLFIY